MKEFRRFSDKSDVYSFGVFLLELVSGREATETPSPESSQSLVEWVCDECDNMHKMLIKYYAQPLSLHMLTCVGKLAPLNMFSQHNYITRIKCIIIFLFLLPM